MLSGGMRVRGFRPADDDQTTVPRADQMFRECETCAAQAAGEKIGSIACKSRGSFHRRPGLEALHPTSARTVCGHRVREAVAKFAPRRSGETGSTRARKLVGQIDRRAAKSGAFLRKRPDRTEVKRRQRIATLFAQ